MWQPPKGVLAELLQSAETRAAALRPRRSELELQAAQGSASLPFAAALRRSDVAVIAELKRASPSRGAISSDLDAARQAVAYVAGGAAAISILTEPSRFSGSVQDLETASTVAAIPLLRKDFIVAVEQLLESRAAGASAVLLIARALRPGHLEELVAAAAALRLETLLEVHTADELERALASGASAIGINARDLETLEVDGKVVPALLARVPADVVCVAESGISNRRDVERIAAAGADAVLVGTALSAADDPVEAVRALTGISRESRAARR